MYVPVIADDNKRVPSGKMHNNLWIKNDWVEAVVIVTADSDLFICLASLRCQYSGPWTSWLRPLLGECFPMRTHTTSTPSLSTATMKPLCPPMIWGSTSGTWRSQTEVSVSFHVIKFDKTCFCQRKVTLSTEPSTTVNDLVVNLNGFWPLFVLLLNLSWWLFLSFFFRHCRH